VYPLCPGGALESRLRSNKEHTEAAAQPLSCQQRVDVAFGVASALASLHACRRVHRDVKSSNVLLINVPAGSHPPTHTPAADANAAAEDEVITPVLSDCGIARVLAPNAASMTTRTVKGTLGYLDPTYHSTGVLQAAVDIFSFGVVLLELLTGQVSRPTAAAQPPHGSPNGEKAAAAPSGPSVPPLVVRLLETPGKHEAVGAVMADASVSWRPDVVEAFARLAVACVHPDGASRPSAQALADQLAPLARPLAPPVFNFDVTAAASEKLPPTSPSNGGVEQPPEDLQLCVACLEAPRLECGHVILCAKCVGPPPTQQTPGLCPLCGSPETAAAFGTDGSDDNTEHWLWGPARDNGNDDDGSDTSSEYIAAAELQATPSRSGKQLLLTALHRSRSGRRRSSSRRVTASRRGLACGAPLPHMRGSPLGEMLRAVGTAFDDLTAPLRLSSPSGPLAAAVTTATAAVTLPSPSPITSSASLAPAPSSMESAPQTATPDARPHGEVQRVAASLGPLVHLLATATTRSAAQEVAAGVVSILALEALSAEAIAESGALPPLVALLRSNHASCREAAAAALANVAAGGTDLARKVARAGAVGPLVRVLAAGASSNSHPWSAPSGNIVAADGSREAAARAVRNMAAGCGDVAAALVHAGAVPPLLQLLKFGSYKGREAAAGALGNLASVPGARDACSAAFAPLVRMMTGTGIPERQRSRKGVVVDNNVGPTAQGGSSDADAIAAAVSLQALVAAHPGNRDAAVAAGCLAPLVTMLASTSPARSPEARAAAAGALCNLAVRAPSVQTQLTQPGPLAALAAALRTARNEPRTAVAAAGCVCNLCVGADEVRAKALVAADMLTPLVRLLAMPDFARTAAKSIKHLAAFPQAVDDLLRCDVVTALSDVLSGKDQPPAGREAAASAFQALCGASPLLVSAHAQNAHTAHRLALCCRDPSPGPAGDALRAAAGSALAALAKTSPMAAEEVANAMESMRGPAGADTADGAKSCSVQ